MDGVLHMYVNPQNNSSELLSIKDFKIFCMTPLHAVVVRTIMYINICY